MSYLELLKLPRRKPIVVLTALAVLAVDLLVLRELPRARRLARRRRCCRRGLRGGDCLDAGYSARRRKCRADVVSVDPLTQLVKIAAAGVDDFHGASFPLRSPFHGARGRISFADLSGARPG